MKKYVVLMSLVALFASGVSAQVGVYRSSGYGAIKKERPKRPKRSYEWTNMPLAGYAYNSPVANHYVTLTYARCKLAGFYANAMIGTDMHTKNLDWGHRKHFLTNTISYPSFAFSVGGMIRMRVPLFAYTGIGYAYIGRNVKTIEGKWISIESSPSFLRLDAGLMASIKHVSLKAGVGYLLLGMHSHANEQMFFEVGIGYSFTDKKKKGAEEQ